jgi:hypothetical protein
MALRLPRETFEPLHPRLRLMSRNVGAAAFATKSLWTPYELFAEWESVMRVLTITIGITLLASAPSFAQVERGYVSGTGGFSVTSDTTDRDVMAEGGVRIAPHLFVFGDVGQFRNLRPSDVQPLVDIGTTASADEGLTVNGTGRVPAVYSVGGLRYQTPARGRLAPYVLGGVGVARLKPTARFAYSSGTFPDGTTSAVGDDVTTRVETAFDLSVPLPENAFMFTLGGGVEIPVSHHWLVNADYRFARMQSDVPLNAQGAAFGFGYRF